MAIFLSDTFTEAGSTGLGSHTPGTGGTWVQRNVSSGGTTRNMTVGAGTGTVTASGDALFTNSATPAGTDHYGEAVWTPPGTAFFAIIFNWTSEGNFYQAVIDNYSDQVRVEKVSGWSASTLGSAFSTTISNGTPYTIRYELTVEGSNKRIKLIFDGVERVNESDTSPLSGVGLTGIRQDFGDCTSIEAGDIGGGAPAYTPRSMLLGVG